MAGIKVKGHSNLRRSEFVSGVITNVDQAGYQARLKRLERQRKHDDHVAEMERLIALMKNKVGE